MVSDVHTYTLKPMCKRPAPRHHTTQSDTCSLPCQPRYLTTPSHFVHTSYQPPPCYPIRPHLDACHQLLSGLSRGAALEVYQDQGHHLSVVCFVVWGAGSGRREGEQSTGGANRSDVSSRCDAVEQKSVLLIRTRKEKAGVKCRGQPDSCQLWICPGGWSGSGAPPIHVWVSCGREGGRQGA